jgi:nicotinate-nucleotide--dimethylbenzimidazole phosphoribosyltransferase
MAARLGRMPVVLDGYACTAAVPCSSPPIRGRSIIASLPAARPNGPYAPAPGPRQAAGARLGMRLGEGSGATLAIAVINAAVACHTGMATFAEAGVSTKAD